ncbi:unnamed protein product [Paramecium octaurelia]|uniref:Uncharacterized protein n=1 Tax=Paramecium octaurelia TaxID=43137 RepID=A0A8S1TB87_PAROT|nr:unnamed protein product [Paramecium octaurelia]
MGEIREQLNNLSQRDIAERLQFLTDHQRSEFKKMMGKVLLFQFQQDEYDKKQWSKLQYQILLSIPLVLSARIVSEYLNANVEFSKQRPTLWIKFLRAMAYKKGIGLGTALLVIPIHKTIEYSRKLGYKHYILSQIKEE